MSYINVVMSLKDFVPYIGEIIEKKNAYLYVEKKIGNPPVEVTAANALEVITDNREKNLNFFISSKKYSKAGFYDDDFCVHVIEGIGGRSTSHSIERIALRLIAKTPDKDISGVFNAIRNQLKKDEEIGMGVEGNSSLHKNFYYQKKYAGNKNFLTDFHNEKAPVITVL